MGFVKRYSSNVKYNHSFSAWVFLCQKMEENCIAGSGDIE